MTTFLYCGVLYLGGAIPADKFYTAMRHFWVGDTVGIITVISVATSAFIFWSKLRCWRWSAYTVTTLSASFVLATCLALAIFLVRSDGEQHAFDPCFCQSFGSRCGQAMPALELGC